MFRNLSQVIYDQTLRNLSAPSKKNQWTKAHPFQRNEPLVDDMFNLDIYNFDRLTDFDHEGALLINYSQKESIIVNKTAMHKDEVYTHLFDTIVKLVLFIVVPHYLLVFFVYYVYSPRLSAMIYRLTEEYTCLN